MGNYTREVYQSQRPSWRNSTDLTGKYVGVELECVAHTAYSVLLNQLPDFKKRRPITERDGSLPVSRGVEIVFPPVKYSTLTNKKSVFYKSITALNGYTNRRYIGAGMHLNINTNGWSTDKRAAFIGTFNRLPEDFLAMKGGRRLTQYCRQNRGASFVDQYLNGSWSRHAASPRGYSRVELRFPRSTTDVKKIKELMKFVQSVEDFAETVTDSKRLRPHKLPDMYKEFLLGSRKYASLYRDFYGKKPRTRKASSKSKQLSARAA